MRGRGEGTLFRRADGYWVGGVEIPTADGTRKQKRVVRKSRADAIKALRELRKEIDAGRIVTTSNTKFALYIEDWLKTVHQKDVKPLTFLTDERLMHRHVLPHLGGKRLDRITARDIRLALDKIPMMATRKRAHTLIRKALNTALYDGMIATNPALAVKSPKYQKREYSAFTEEIGNHILRVAESSLDEMWAARFACGLLTGLRESEVLGLEWDRVDLVNDQLLVDWQLQGLRMTHGCGPQLPNGGWPCGRNRKPSSCPQAYWDLPEGFEYRVCERHLLWTRPKTKKSERVVPIIAPLKRHLLKLQATIAPNPHNLVFHHPDGSPFTHSQDQRKWRELLQIAGVDHARQHTLRKTTATLLRKANVDEQTRMELFGHATAEVQRGYAQGDWELQKAALGKLVAMLELEE